MPSGESTCVCVCVRVRACACVCCTCSSAQLTMKPPLMSVPWHVSESWRESTQRLCLVSRKLGFLQFFVSQCLQG